MIDLALIDTVLSAVNVVAATDEDGVPVWLLLAGPAGAIAVYSGLYRYYRNTDKSHQFERDTIIESQPVTGGEEKVDEVRGTKRTAINGNNVKKYRERVQRVQ